MTREQQDKLWNELSEETQQYYKEKYKFHLSNDGGCDLAVLRSQTIVKELENMFGSHNLNPKPLTYEDIERELMNVDTWVLTSLCASKQMLNKLSAIYKLLMVAKYINGDWKPDWEDGVSKWFLCIVEEEIETVCVARESYSIVYFRTEEIAKQAIQILGEETIRLALSTDF